MQRGGHWASLGNLRQSLNKAQVWTKFPAISLAEMEFSDWWLFLDQLNQCFAHGMQPGGIPPNKLTLKTAPLCARHQS